MSRSLYRVGHVHWEANWYLISHTSFIVLTTCSLVLDEAHKYLTNADANRFTKTICSIIRQQRHLAARVIVSTQEPTVVPASVLDLLSWVVCHRFSSPSWVKHLRHHLCVEEAENKADDDLPVPSDWGQRVMALRTGEALLYSPGSLFLSQRGRLATLSSGYAVIKTRPRLTRDGGASLLATQGDSSIALNNIPTPAASNSSTSPLPIASVLGINLHRASSGTPSNSDVGRFMTLLCCSNKFLGFDDQGYPGGRTQPAFFTRTGSFVEYDRKSVRFGTFS